MIDDAFIEAMRVELERRLAEIDDLSAGAAGSRQPVELDQSKVGRLSRMDALQGQAMAQAQQERRVIDKRRIETALKRIENDEYGACVKCGEDIAEERLRFDPAAPLCIDCAQG